MLSAIFFRAACLRFSGFCIFLWRSLGTGRSSDSSHVVVITNPIYQSSSSSTPISDTEHSYATCAINGWTFHLTTTWTIYSICQERIDIIITQAANQPEWNLLHQVCYRCHTDDIASCMRGLRYSMQGSREVEPNRVFVVICNYGCTEPRNTNISVKYMELTLCSVNARNVAIPVSNNISVVSMQDK